MCGAELSRLILSSLVPEVTRHCRRDTVLLIGAALLLQSFRNLLAVNPGFQSENVLMGQLLLPASRHADNTQVLNFYDQLLEHVRALPGVQAAGMSQVSPFSGRGQGGPFTVEGQELREGDPAKLAQLRRVTLDYLTAMGMPILQGRSFASTDTETAPPVVIVDETLAPAHWPQGDAVGRLRIGGDKLLTIVGVVPSVKYRSLNEDTKPHIYRPMPQWVSRGMTLVMRTANDSAALIPALRREMASLDPELPFFKVSTVEQAMAQTLSTKQLTNLLLTSFAALALLLALLGIYGVMSLNVGSRRSEFGIRLALGAHATDVLWLVVGQGMRLALVGVVLGLDLKPTDFKRFCGVKPHTFATMVKALAQPEQQKKKKGRAADLCLEDQLLLALQYWREYRTYFHLSVSWGVMDVSQHRGNPRGIPYIYHEA
jgi:putative ABC transport system permease protein